MKRWLGGAGTAVLAALIAPIAAGATARAADAGRLEIYFIDVEGGQSTLIVTPRRESLLIDSGFAGNGTGFQPGDPHKARDANRIAAAAREAGVSQIDYLLITHFHPDHDGGVSELSQLMPIRNFIDHGVPNAQAVASSEEVSDAFKAYVAVRSTGKHLEPHPGDRLPLKELNVEVVSSAGATLDAPLPGAGKDNDACGIAALPARDPLENVRSTGVVLEFGKFRFLDLGDLSGAPLRSLACPKNLIGPVDVYLVAHHGGPDVADPATFRAFGPRVAIVNDGQSKGGARVTLELLHDLKVETWELHRSTDAGPSNFPDRFVANLDESTDHWIKVIARADGSFELINRRTGETRQYPTASCKAGP